MRGPSRDAGYTRAHEIYNAAQVITSAMPECLVYRDLGPVFGDILLLKIGR